MDIKAGATHCEGISVQKHHSDNHLPPKMSSKSISQVSKGLPLQHPTNILLQYTKIKMSACLLLTVGSSTHVIYRTAQNGPGPTKIWYLKPFYVRRTSLAQPSIGAVYNEFIRGSSAFELDQTAINPTLLNQTQPVLACVEGFQ